MARRERLHEGASIRVTGLTSVFNGAHDVYPVSPIDSVMSKLIILESPKDENHPWRDTDETEVDSCFREHVDMEGGTKKSGLLPVLCAPMVRPEAGAVT